MNVKLLLGLVAIFGFNQTWAVPCSDTTSGVFLLGSVDDAPVSGDPVGSPSDSVAINCEDGLTNNDPYPTNLSAFGMTFKALQKQNTPSTLETQVNINLNVTPTTGTLSGDWSFTNIAAYDTYVVVLKDGGSPKWASYLLDSSKFGGNNSIWSGDWVYGQGKQLSHLSVYGKLSGNSVSAPAILGIMGIGLMGVLLSSRFRRKT